MCYMYVCVYLSRAFSLSLEKRKSGDREQARIKKRERERDRGLEGLKGDHLPALAFPAAPHAKHAVAPALPQRKRRCSSVHFRACGKLFVTDTMYIVYRQVFQIPLILRFEHSMDTFSLRSDVISSVKNGPGRGWGSSRHEGV
jgi:hypothetical protein